MKTVIFHISALLISLYLLNLGLFFTFDTQKKIEGSPPSDIDLGWTFSGYTLRGFNDVGIRHPMSSSEIKNIKKLKFLFLGNSVVGGLAVPWNQTFSYLSENRIRALLGPDVYVFNGGQDGYEIFREFLKYRRDFSSLNFNYVIWFPNTNDFQSKAAVFKNFVMNHQGQSKSTRSVYFNLTSGFKLLSAKIKSLKENATEKYLWSEKSKFYTQPLLNDLKEQNLSEIDSEIESFNIFLKSKSLNNSSTPISSISFCSVASSVLKLKYGYFLLSFSSNKPTN
jgi:hypothetical protein